MEEIEYEGPEASEDELIFDFGEAGIRALPQEVVETE
jgi:hypothetical protein